MAERTDRQREGTDDMRAPATARASAAALLAVQRNAGNAAVLMVMRSQELDAAAVQRARGWYRRRPELLPPSLLTRIHEHLDLPARPTVDDAFIQGIAAWQREHAPQPVDGLAGERTLAEMFPSGLATDRSIEATARAQGGITEDWSELADRRARLVHLLGPINDRLRASGVPPCNPRLPEEAASLTTGSFSNPTWSIAVHDAYLQAEPPADGALGSLMQTLYHEARHAEQHFLVARLVAAREPDLSAEDLAERLAIPAHVASAASAKPLVLGGPDAVVATGLHRSMYGPRFEALWRRRRAAGAAADRAFERYERSPTEVNLDRFNRAEARRDRLHEEYRQQSHEFDAFRVGRRLRELLDAP